jgi:MoaE-MoaD fusion protein
MQRVHVSVLLFAGLRERAGVDRVEVELPDGAVVGDVLAAMGETPVGPIGPRQCVVAVNREYAGAEEPVREGDEVALVPPVSGGAADPTGSTPVDGAAARTRSRGATGAQALRRARVTGEALDLGALAAAVRDPRAGAVVLFEGVTREVDELRYEAYAEMAEPRLAAIAAEEAERHGLCAVAVEHRTGAVALGEPSVIVAASAPHRGEAFAGARAVIDRVKAEAPIWKQEVTDAGTRRVEGTLPPAP